MSVALLCLGARIEYAKHRWLKATKGDEQEKSAGYHACSKSAAAEEGKGGSDVEGKGGSNEEGKASGGSGGRVWFWDQLSALLFSRTSTANETEGAFIEMEAQ